MLRSNLFRVLLLVSFLTFAAAAEADSSEHRGLLEDNAISSILPRYFSWIQTQPIVENPSRPTKEVVKPIIIVSGDNQGHHLPPYHPYPPYYPNPYWPYYPAPPSSPDHHPGSPPTQPLTQPPTQPPSHPHDHNNYPPYYHHHHHHHHQQGGNYGGVGGGPAFIIINPSNLQALGGPPYHGSGSKKPSNSGTDPKKPPKSDSDSSKPQISENESSDSDTQGFRSNGLMFAGTVPNPSAPSNGNGLSPEELNSLTNILQGIDSMDNFNDSTNDDGSDASIEVSAKYAPTKLESGKAYTANLNPATLNLSPEEFSSLQQVTRNLSPKQLLTLFSKDKGRQRKQVQEAVAGIYLRNFNLNKK